MRKFLFLFLFLFPYVSFSQNMTLDNYREAKEKLAQIYLNKPITFYCGCSFDMNSPDWNSCNYKPRKNIKRALHITYEYN